MLFLQYLVNSVISKKGAVSLSSQVAKISGPYKFFCQMTKNLLDYTLSIVHTKRADYFKFHAN